MNFDKLTAFLDEQSIDMVPGMDCIVYRDHQQIYRHLTGFRDRENGITMNGDEQYWLFSATKVFTATAGMQLIERGIIRPEDPVSMYLPAFATMSVNDEGHIRAPRTEMTIRHLFTMSAGLTYDFNTAPVLAARAVKGAATVDIANAFIETPLSFEPGYRFQYSLCHDVLGAIASVITGMSFAAFMEKELFSPLGMKDTSFSFREDEMAKKYVYKDGAYLPDACSNSYILGENYHSGGAGVVSTLHDFALFADALACGEGKDGYLLIRRESVDLLRTEQLRGLLKNYNFGCAAGDEFGYGLGVHTLTAPNSETKAPLGVFGWDGAAGAYIMCDPEHKLSIAYLTHVHNWPSVNKNAPFHRELRNAVCEAVLG